MDETPPPLALDIDGTMTRRDGGLDPRVIDPLREWDAPVVIATGKSFPYPVGLCNFIGVEVRVIAETGGVVCADDEVRFNGDGEAAWAAVNAFVEAGFDVGWGDVDLVNRWRETEVAVNLDAPLDVLRKFAEEYGQEVVDTGYAYHVKSPDVSKGLGLETMADLLGFAPEAFVAVGDSENDAATFDVAGRSIAVANADAVAEAAADEVTDKAYADGLLEVLDKIQ